MPDFKNPRLCTIYKISSYDLDDKDFYIGSTTMRLNKRINDHKYHYNYGVHMKLYDHIRSNGGWSWFYHELIHTEIVKSKDDQYRCEQKHIDELKPTLNVYRSHITPEQQKAKKKIYVAEHKEEAKARHAKWKATHEEHLKEYKRKYYLHNKARIKEKYKANYQKAKARILAKVECECGRQVCKVSLAKHKLTDLHKRFMARKESQ